MASLSLNRKTGRRTIQFVWLDGKRRSIRLGKVSERTALKVKVKVEDLAAARMSGHIPSDETIKWLTSITDNLRNKLVAVGLVDQTARVTIKAFIDDYIKRRTDIKRSTRLVMEHTRRNLIDYFGADRPIRDISPGEVDEWLLYLNKHGLADNTIRRRCGVAKQFFTHAIRKKLITENPFSGLKSSVQGNPRRYFFVTRDMAHKVLDACPDAEWRLIFALSRFGGLRCPSEHLALRWSDINWEQDRFTVTSSKTEHHAGGESRQVPIFPEILPYLREVFEQAEPGVEFVITRYRDPKQNLRTTFEKIIIRAGLEPWRSYSKIYEVAGKRN